MKVCYFGFSLVSMGGNANYCSLLIQKLLEDGHQATIVTINKQEKVDIDPRIKLKIIGYNGKLNSYERIKIFLKTTVYFLGNNDFDLIHSISSFHSFSILARLAGLASRRPVVHTFFSPVSRILCKALRFQQVIFVSKNTLGGGAEDNRGKNIIPPFINYKEFNHERGEYIGKRDMRIGTMGTPIFRRGLDVFIRTAPYIIKKYPETKFFMAIRLPQVDFYLPAKKEFNKLIKMIKELNLSNHIEILGKVNISRFLADIDIFVYPVQTTKGMIDIPLTILEVLASGCPMVTSKKGSIEELIKNRVNGMMVENQETANPQAYAEKILELIDNEGLRNDLRLNSKMSVKDYDIKGLYPKILSIYEKIKVKQ